MKLVEAPHLEPYRTPLEQLSPNGYIDTECDVTYGRLYLSEVEAGMAAELFGWVSPAEHKATLASISELEDRVTQLQFELADARSQQVQVVPVSEMLKLVGTGDAA